MADVKKVTKKENYEVLRGVVEGAGLEAEVEARLVEMIDKEIATLNKKRAGKSKAEVEANATLAEIVYEAIARAGKAVTVSDILADEEVANATYEVKEKGEVIVKKLTNQKVTALVKVLGDRVVKVTEKKKTYISIAD